jgi:hypothetical protein
MEEAGEGRGLAFFREGKCVYFERGTGIGSNENIDELSIDL